ncbi:RNA-directed DNA polymerase [Exiguobacterium sp. s6]|uniref:RNA-directed DNA polymerase n=1 Tax=Exiguobacterium sp. s6 TaxID=2751236 RepID=UPI001BEADFBB|nr:RNA-directed DNA polymerase [Exiguobacterium sp. s6]
MESKFNRQKLDYVISDLLPYEKGNFFTNKYLYEYLLVNKKKYNSILKLTKMSTSKKFDASWHSVPLKYKVKKKDEKYREISFINPLGLVESLLFIEIFEYDLLNIIQKKSVYSLRTPFRVNNLYYKKDNNQTVYYTNENEKKQLLISLESSGDYFRHKPYKRITEFYNSNVFNYSQDKFNALIRIDIQDCFSSIYTHSFKWLISNKTYDSKNLKNASSIYSNLDSFLQNLNGSKTNGILVGPEVMRLAAEFLFVHLDQEILETLSKMRIENDIDYRIFRFVDDYFIFSNHSEIETEIVKVVRDVLNKYHLKINEAKLKRFDNSISFNKWKYKAEEFVPELEKLFYKSKDKVIPDEVASELNLDDNQLTLIKEINSWFRQNNKKVKYTSISNKYRILLEETGEKDLVTSYSLSVILKKLEHLNKNEINFSINENDLVTVVFLLYSTDITYTSTQKIIRILTLLKDKFELDITPSSERSIERFGEKIFKSFPSDWIDLLLFFGLYQIEIPEKQLNLISNKIFEEDNPVVLAAMCMYFKQTSYMRSFNNRLNKIIESKVSKINWNRIFEDKEVWWIFIFYSYPNLSKSLKKNIEEAINDIIQIVSLRPGAVNLAQKLILEFLLNEPNHFIEWGFVKDNYYKEYFYYTKDRTIFNPGIINQIYLSR